MPETARPLSLLTRIGDESAGFGQLSEADRERWWTDRLPAAIDALSGPGGRLIGLWRSTWASDWHYFMAHEFPDLQALESAAERLGAAGLFRNVHTSRLLGQRWDGEPGWNADKWAAREQHAPIGGVMYYRISESLYTLSGEQMTGRHNQRRRLLDSAIANLIEAGGQRLGSYFCEWSSEWHLYVLYEFPDLEAAAAFNRDLPERHGYIDYDVVFLLGRRLESPRDMVRP